MREAFFFAALTGMVATSCHAGQPFVAQGVRVIDADTVHVDLIPMGWGIALVDATFRANDFDAWERTRVRFKDRTTEEELRKGQAATDGFRRLLSEDGNRLMIVPPPGGSDIHLGRYSGVWYVLARDGSRIKVSEWMQERGFVRKNEP